MLKKGTLYRSSPTRRYTRPDNHNTLTHQSSDTKYAPRDPFTAPLHVILPRHGPNLHYGYVYVPMHLLRCQDHRKHCTAAPRAHPWLHQVSNASANICIRSYVLAAVSNWIWIHCFSIWFDSIVVFILLDSIVFFRFDLTHA